MVKDAPMNEFLNETNQNLLRFVVRELLSFSWVDELLKRLVFLCIIITAVIIIVKHVLRKPLFNTSMLRKPRFTKIRS